MPHTGAQLVSGWDEFAAAMKNSDTECPTEFGDIEEAVTYLRTTLGEDYLDEVRQISKHPFRSLMFISWPGLRSDFLDCPPAARSRMSERGKDIPGSACSQ